MRTFLGRGSRSSNILLVLYSDSSLPNQGFCDKHCRRVVVGQKRPYNVKRLKFEAVPPRTLKWPDQIKPQQLVFKL